MRLNVCAINIYCSTFTSGIKKVTYSNCKCNLSLVRWLKLIGKIAAITFPEVLGSVRL